MIIENSPTLLEVRGLRASVNGTEILKNLDFTVKRGEVHAIMGPNGSGKSTFAKVLAGHTAYQVTGGAVLFEGKNLLELSPELRARAGVFLAFQYPIEIPGVGNSQFLRLAYNTVQAERGQEELDPLEFDDLVREKMKQLEMSPEFLERSVNEGFSGRWRCSNPVWPSWMKPTRAWTSTRCVWCRKASIIWPKRITPSCWSRTTSAC